MTTVGWPDLARLFDELLDAAPAERERSLAALRAERPELAGELDRLLAADAGAGGLLDRGLGTLAAGGESGDEDLTGQLAGPYRLTSRIGRGGMGTVYAARRDDGLYEQRVAVKVLAAAGSPELMRRFARERAILAALDHPHIARLLDAGSIGARPFVVMELVEGVSLVEHCDRTRADVATRLRLYLQACAAVAFAHRHLVVHRDLKPSNVLVDGAGAVKLLDFGIASLLDPDQQGERGVTMTRRAFTPAYAAPEQVLGESITTAADVYGMGALLHELLVGRPPAPAWAAVGASTVTPTVALAALPAPEAERVAIARGAEPRALLRALRGDLDAIAGTALRRRPELRYHSVEALADDVARHLAGLPVQARGPDRAYRARLFLRRHRAAIAASVLAVGALGAGLSAALVQAGTARSEARRAATLREFLQEELKREIVDGHMPSPDGPAVGELFARGLAHAGGDFGDRPESEAELFSIAGETFRMTRSPDRAVAAFGVALGKKRALYGEGDPRVREARLDLAEGLLDAGRAPDAFALLRALEHDTPPDEIGQRIDVLTSYGLAARRCGDLALAERAYREWLALVREEQGAGGLGESKPLARLVELTFHQGRYGASLAWIGEQMERERRQPRANARRDAYLEMRRALVLERRGDLERAAGSYDLARSRLQGTAQWPAPYLDCGRGLLLVERGELAAGRALLATASVATATPLAINIGFDDPGAPCPALRAWARGDVDAVAALAPGVDPASMPSRLDVATRELLAAELLLGRDRAAEALPLVAAAVAVRDAAAELLPWRRAEAHLLHGLTLSRLGQQAAGAPEAATAATSVRAAVPRHRYLALAGGAPP